MFYLKLTVVLAFVIFEITGCFSSKPGVFVIADSKSYETSLYRQDCAVCHGPEAEGKTLDDGTKVPSLRTGEFKFKTVPEISKQITDGGHGMPPFGSQLTGREIEMMAEFVARDLRSGK
jgi:cytochrome c553